MQGQEEMKTRQIDAMRRRYKRLAAQLPKLGLVLRGTITQRTIVRNKPKTPGGRKTYGPYYQWTWKDKGKTVTVNLTASQAKLYQRAIDNQRKLERIVREMRDVSLKILEATTEGVKKRKRQSKKHLGLK